MRRDVEGTQIGHMIDGVIGLVFAHHDAAIREQALRARRKLVGKLPITDELLRGSLLDYKERTVRHSKDCAKCASFANSIMMRPERAVD